MADLSGRPRNRGQLLIITALSIAVLLVLLALALNTAVFGEVHVASTDDTLQEERSAVQYEKSVHRGIEPLILPVNEKEANGDDELADALAEEISRWVSATSEMYAHSGASTNVELEQTHFETDVTHDDETREFTNRSESTDWTVAENVEQVEHYEITVDNVDDIAPGDCFGKDACFNISVNGGDWVLSVYSKDDEIAVKVDGESECTSDSPATINMTDGSLNGSPCFTPFTDDTEKIEYSNADNVTGTYNLSADGRFDEENYHDADSGDSPRFDPRIVAADVSVQYRSSELHYRNEFRIVPDDANE